MGAFSDRLLLGLTRRLNRVHPRIPVVAHWPGRARIVERLLAPVRRPVIWRLATRHRRRLPATTFVAVTGSAGKTMTKAMIAAVLRSGCRVSARADTSNYEHSTAESILMARRDDHFCVIELSAGYGPGSLRRQLGLLRPAIGVVTNVGSDHHTAFGSRDAIAAEKGSVIRALPQDGIAILNADDPRVISMRSDCRARVITYGSTSEADVRAESVVSSWPDRLSFELVHGGRRVAVQTQMCGAQWVTSALAAAAVGLAAGFTLHDIARSLGAVEPFVGRMSPLALPDGVTFIRDDWKASAHTIPPSLEFLGAARAARKVAVIGTIADTGNNARAAYVRTARHALEVADLVVFVGGRSSVALRVKPEKPERLRAFSTVKAAAEFLSTFLTAGDLVLLKGSNPADHLYRIVLSRTSQVGCWRMDCRKTIFCDSCKLLHKAAPVRDERAFDEPGQRAQAATAAPGEETGLVTGSNILVGLGNPGSEHANTPHNVGHALLDRIAAEANADWSEGPLAQLACVEWHGIPLCLVKPKALVNHSGPVLRELLSRSGIEPDRAVLVFDDINLPLGKVRVRLHGSDGGHRGVRSILEAFQTHAFRRIKIGVQRKAERTRDAVLRPFTKAEQPIVTAALDQACSRLPDLFDREICLSTAETAPGTRIQS